MSLHMNSIRFEFGKEFFLCISAPKGQYIHQKRPRYLYSIHKLMALEGRLLQMWWTKKGYIPEFSTPGMYDPQAWKTILHPRNFNVQSPLNKFWFDTT